MVSAADHGFMAQALRLAERGLLTTTPNPRVGCVIVRDGCVVGEGWHEKAGEPHAEVHALRQAGEAARGATAYVTLEPCSHHGRTPPCCEALSAAGIQRVVAAMQDPNPLVAGQGLAWLTDVGIETDCGVLENEARELNIGFVSRMTRGRPWVRLKAAASLDGRTALENGDSQWITGAAARADGHRWRARACAVLTGIGTVRADDPQLTVREVATSRQPLLVVVDSRLEIDPRARILSGERVLVVGGPENHLLASVIETTGAEVLFFPDAEGRVDLAGLMRELAKRGVNEVHVEAGARLNGALLQAGLVDEIVLYLAPSIVGDMARGLFAMPALERLADQRRLVWQDVRPVGGDLRVIARLS